MKERHGPAVVAMGGGHGLAASLAAIRRYAADVTAVVSVADDGGSSGRLRADYGVLPPGDLRKCLVALADPGSGWTHAFEYRFETGDLAGHALGNLVITGLAATTGDFEAALAEAARVLGATGRVLPATTEPVVLKATARAPEGDRGYGGGIRAVEGQVAVAGTEGITSVSLVPADARPPQAALDALERADQVVVGPGSLYTSVLAALVVPALREALAATKARKVYVCNLRAQVPEATGYDVAAHVEALRAHGVEVDVVVTHPGALPLGHLDVEHVEWPVADPAGQAHDPRGLAAALSHLIG